MAMPWNQVIVSIKLGLGDAPVEAAPPPAMAELAAVKPLTTKARPATAAAVYDTAETAVVLPLEICEEIQPELLPSSRFVSSRVAEAAISGIEKATEGISLAYSDVMACVPLAEKVPAGTFTMSALDLTSKHYRGGHYTNQDTFVRHMYRLSTD